MDRMTALETPMSNAPRKCPVCLTAIPNEFPEGLCPRCMMAAAVPAAEDSPAEDAWEDIRFPAGVMGPDALQRMFPELEILGLVGFGGMGAVYKARQPRLDRLVALKVMKADQAAGPDFALRFEREARMLARLSHPNIVAIHDFGEVGPATTGGETLYYFLMEHVEGTDLAHLIGSGELQPSQALAIVPQICEALQYAHDEGVTHRDIKPGNILLDLRGNVRVADFGLARMAADGVGPLETQLTQAGLAMGTPHYMAPEKWEHPERVDHRADIYALGVVFYEMLTGERPAGVFKPPSQKAEVDVRLDSVVMKAMEREPGHRYQRASEIRNELTTISLSSPPVVRKAWWKGRVPLALSATVLLGIFAGLAWMPEEGDAAANERKIPPATADERQNFRLVMVAMDPKAREINPGAPWDLDRADLVDLQVSHTSTNGYQGLPLDHSVTMALTADGKLLDWINTIPGKSVIPPVLRDAEVEQFSIYGESNRTVAMLSNGDVMAWSWKLDPENQSVDGTEPEKIDFGRPDRPVKVRSVGYDTLVAIYEDGGINVDAAGVDPIDPSKLDGNAAVTDLSANFLALLKDGSLINVASDNLKRGPVPLISPEMHVTQLQASPYFASATLENGSLWYWNENEIDLSTQFLPMLERAGGNGRITDFRAYQSGGSRYAVKNDSGNWYVSHGDMTTAQRKDLKDAAVVYRHEDYAIGLMSDQPPMIDNGRSSK